MKSLLSFFIFCLSAASTLFAQNDAVNGNVMSRDSVYKRYYDNGAANYSITRVKFQRYLDTLLQYLPNEDEIWQQRSTPLFKAGKYEIGMKYLDKAVALDKKKHVSYRAFIKCIFTKQHLESIKDYQDEISLNGELYHFDHPYSFFIGLNYLQMNELDSAKYYLERALTIERQSKSEGFLSATNFYYLGIIEYEKRALQPAIVHFDKALNLVGSFTEAKFYKGLAEYSQGNKELANQLLKEALGLYHADYLFPEYNSIYEHFPYEVRKSTIQYYLENLK